jgi:hypothetical protein
LFYTLHRGKGTKKGATVQFSCSEMRNVIAKGFYFASFRSIK